MTQRPRGTSARPLARLLEASDRPAWLIDASGRLAYLSAACGDWLGVAPEALLGRRAIAGVAASDDLLDRIAAALAPPAGLTDRGIVAQRVHPPLPADQVPRSWPPTATGSSGSSGSTGSTGSTGRPILFIQLEPAAGRSVLALADHALPSAPPADLDAAMHIRDRLTAWRLRQPKLASLAVAQGASLAAQRLRRQVELATATREHVTLIGPPGCGSESIARVIHRSASQDAADNSALPEPIVTVDGPLMDAELLDATIAPAIHMLAEEPGSRVTLLVRGIDQTAVDAQERLNRLADEHGRRLRLLVLQSAAGSPPHHATPMHPPLAARTSVLQIDVPPLGMRSDDIPTIATALLDIRRAAGEGSADRFSRAALDALVLYPWPQNVEELNASIRHAIRSCRGTSIQPDHLPLAVRSYHPGDPGQTAVRNLMNLDRTLARIERQLIERAVQQADGNRAAAARLLGISRARLLRRLDESSADESSADESSADEVE